MRKICAMVICLIAIVSSGPGLAGPSIVFDVTTGSVLAAEEPYRRWYPASITKLMTTYIALKAVKTGEKTMKSPVVVSKNAASEPPSKMGYPVGSVLTLEAALRTMMVKSANDISVAVAEAVAGSESEFIAMMNEEAGRIGMSGTHWVNANGLPDERQYSNARDLALLVAALRRDFPEQADLFAIEAISVGNRVLTNYNVLLGRFPGADGMKTGFICASGYNLAATATRDGRTIGTIILGALSPTERAEKAANLMAQGFATSSIGKPVLAALPDAGDSKTATDMRPQICTANARSARTQNRDENGRMVFHTPHLQPMDRQPVAVPVRLGGAVGIPTAVVEHADVPIPSPRPDYRVPAIAEEKDGAPTELKSMAQSRKEPEEKPGHIITGIPVPTPRASVLQ